MMIKTRKYDIIDDFYDPFMYNGNFNTVLKVAGFYFEHTFSQNMSMLNDDEDNYEGFGLFFKELFDEAS